ncbi:MAG TPA: transcriptional repressor [Candidatus Limadaptatus stercorigallinarum]|uniref:Transcriptional repressor n=1 Tax=Candidatus Limadaptatus stercorigallinarum TaxID=2840845 RepID=A0A9D1HS88_9FIRM|nr:transcriptional repressor [Christensenellales bacterium]HIU20778.1 transcriptional repressor [Candidatus Limadaptatus stercorigallinarum]
MQAELAQKRNTRQKSAIEAAVLSSCDHPTAVTVCERVRKEIPNISLGTVYRVLGMLTREGKVREITVPGAPSRFDKTTSIHAHFLCTECGELTDVNVGENEFVKHAKEACGNAEITEAEIIFKGLCASCKGEKL